MVMFVRCVTICILILSEIFAYSYKRRPSASWIYPQDDDDFYNSHDTQSDYHGEQRFNNEFYNTQSDSNSAQSSANVFYNTHGAQSAFFDTQEDEDFFGQQKQRRQTQLTPPPGFQKNRPNPNNLAGGFTWGDPRRSDDFYVFDAFAKEEPTSTVAIPGMETTQSPCEDRCRTTFQYNPVCGSNGRTFYNPARLSCAQKCGQKISLNHIGAC